MEITSKQLPHKYHTWVELWDDIKILDPSHTQISMRQEVVREKHGGEITSFEDLYFDIKDIKINAFEEIMELRDSMPLQKKEIELILHTFDRCDKHPISLKLRNYLSSYLFHFIMPNKATGGCINYDKEQ